MSRSLESLKSVREQHPGDVAELATVRGQDGKAYLANVVLDSSAILIQPRGGVTRPLAWADITGFKMVQYGKTCRDCLEVALGGESVCLMPVSEATLFPLSVRRAELFFDSIRKHWGSAHPK